MPQGLMHADTDTIAVMIVDDHQMFAQAVAKALTDEAGISLAGIAHSLRQAREMVESAQPIDVVLVDQRLPDGHGTDLVREWQGKYRRTKILMVSASIDDVLISDALRAGCAGYVKKSDSMQHLIEAVRVAHSGFTTIPPDVMNRLIQPRGTRFQLTRRELSILQLLVDGYPPHEICERAFITRNTLANHVNRILIKLEVHSRVEAVAKAIRLGLVSAPDSDAGGSTRDDDDRPE